MVTQTQHIRLEYSRTFGCFAPFGGVGFWGPVAIARGEGDRIYVLSRGLEFLPQSKRVTICTLEDEYISEFGRGVTRDYEASSSPPDGAFVWPVAIALDRENNVYISDEWANRISIFTKDGEWVGKWGTPGEGDGEINRPSGLAFDEEDNLYLVDSLNHRIQKFTKDGRFLEKWGHAGDGDGEFNMPWGIDIDKNGDVYVADWRNNRIQKFSPQGRFLMKFGTLGTGDGQFDRPTGVAVDQDGVIYVADWGNDRLQVFDAAGNFATAKTGDATMSKWGADRLNANTMASAERARAQGMEREKQFWGPVAVAVDAENRIFVAENPRQRIQIYRKQAPIFMGSRI